MESIKTLCNYVKSLEVLNNQKTSSISRIRKLQKQIDTTIVQSLNGQIELTSAIISNYKDAVNMLLQNSDLSVMSEQRVRVTHTVINFQLTAPEERVILSFDENSRSLPERGIIIQPLWKVKFKDGSTGYAIFSDASDTDLATVLQAQEAPILNTVPDSALELVDITVNIENIHDRDLTQVFATLEKPGLVSRQLRDVNIDTDPALQGLTVEQKEILKEAVQNDTLESVIAELGLTSIALGPHANPDYSDFKRFKVLKKDGTEVSVTVSMPIITWGGEDIKGIPLRNDKKNADKHNRLDDGTCYVVDLGGRDPVIRDGRPNPLPATKYVNNGPPGATDGEGALERYKGGKCFGINTTKSTQTFKATHFEKDGEITVEVPAESALWSLDRAAFEQEGRRHVYYTVFSASRPPAAGYMGVPLSTKQNRVGRGKGVIASGVTMADGVSATGKLFMKQDINGAILEDGVEVGSGLKGLTSSFNGHGMHPKELLKFLQDNTFVKGTQYLTIPANATLDTVEDVLIPAGEFVPRLSNGVASLYQFGNGKYVQDGGPNRFQPGIVPFLPGTPAYTPIWHILWAFFNCGSIWCEGVQYEITNVARTNSPTMWTTPNKNVSVSAPKPNASNSEESGYSPAHPSTFDPVQLRCGLKDARCTEYIDTHKGVVDSEISLSMVDDLVKLNNLFITDAPPGAMEGWVKYLIVNCPLPVVVDTSVTILDNTSVPDNTVIQPTVVADRPVCNCDREKTFISINGVLNSGWVDEDVSGLDHDIPKKPLFFKVGDRIKIASTSTTAHGVALRFDDMTAGVNFDITGSFEEQQDEVLVEIKTLIDIHNEEDIEYNPIAFTSEFTEFQNGLPITFKTKANVNPLAFPDGITIAEFTIKNNTLGRTGTIMCPVHSTDMFFTFQIC